MVKKSEYGGNTVYALYVNGKILLEIIPGMSGWGG
jgi:hypothetical protein